MCFDDFLNIWDNISICKQFSQIFKCQKFNGEWNDANSGGTPLSNDQNSMVSYMKNP